MKTFDNEWILEAFDGHPSLFTKRMFGGLAAYLFERQMLVLVEPTKTGRWKWHGVLVCTDHEHQPSIRAQFPALIYRKYKNSFPGATRPESSMVGQAPLSLIWPEKDCRGSWRSLAGWRERAP